MSTRIGNLIGRRFQPRLLPALLKVAVIGAWENRGVSDADDDLEQAELLAAIEADRRAAAAQQPVPTPLVAPAADPAHPAAA